MIGCYTVWTVGYSVLRVSQDAVLENAEHLVLLHHCHCHCHVQGHSQENHHQHSQVAIILLLYRLPSNVLVGRAPVKSSTLFITIRE